jgi:hypothetical protein
VVERVGLENRSTRKGTVGSNPTLSAIHFQHIQDMHQGAVPAADKTLRGVVIAIL